jgi:hypothetical protein
MGYLGPEALANLANYSDGVRLKGGPTLTQCDSCGISKMTRQVSRRQRITPGTPGERLAVDLFSFEKSYDGY